MNYRIAKRNTPLSLITGNIWQSLQYKATLRPPWIQPQTPLGPYPSFQLDYQIRIFKPWRRFLRLLTCWVIAAAAESGQIRLCWMVLVVDPSRPLVTSSIFSKPPSSPILSGGRGARGQVWSLFCWLFTIKDRCKKVCFLQTHSQSLLQLLLTVS